MKKILNFGKIYKYEIIGLITLCILYLCFHIYSKGTNDEKDIVKKPVNNEMNDNNSKKSYDSLL